MAIQDGILPEFDHEMANTRKTLERVPEDRPAWKPHDKSMPLARLAGYLAELPGWTVETLEKESVYIHPADGMQVKPTVMTSRKQLLETFDKNVAAARAAIAKATDETLMKPWTLLAGGKTIFTLPRVAVLRGFVMNHMIHHRAQLSVYLRPNNLPVPAIYGPSADES